MGCVSCNSSKKTGGCKNSGSCSRCNNFSVFDWLSNITPPSNEKNYSLIELSFKNGRKKYYSNNAKINISLKDPIVVKCDIGYDIGLVSLKGELVKLQLRRKKISKKDYDYCFFHFFNFLIFLTLLIKFLLLFFPNIIIIIYNKFFQ